MSAWYTQQTRRAWLKTWPMYVSSISEPSSSTFGTISFSCHWVLQNKLVVTNCLLCMLIFLLGFFLSSLSLSVLPPSPQVSCQLPLTLITHMCPTYISLPPLLLSCICTTFFFPPVPESLLPVISCYSGYNCLFSSVVCDLLDCLLI